MEPPKKRKFDSAGVGLSSSLNTSTTSLNLKSGSDSSKLSKLDDQLHVVSNSDVVPAKRNRRSYSLEFTGALVRNRA